MVTLASDVDGKANRKSTTETCHSVHAGWKCCHSVDLTGITGDGRQMKNVWISLLCLTVKGSDFEVSNLCLMQVVVLVYQPWEHYVGTL